MTIELVYTFDKVATTMAACNFIDGNRNSLPGIG
jgi:hypothetical protein